MSVLNGQLANQTTFNNAFMSRTAATTSTVAIVTLNNGVGASGAAVSNVQEAINETFDAVGMTGVNDTTRNDYSSNEVIADGDDRKEAIQKLDAEYNNATGHSHSGAAGDGAPISAPDLINYNDFWCEYQAFNFSAAAGPNDDVSAGLVGRAPGGNAATLGVLTGAPDNLCFIVDLSTGTFLEDAGGQRIYGRLTYSASVWTLTYYTNEAGVETAASISPATDINVLYRQVFSSATRPTVPSNPSEFGTLDVTADVVDANTNQAGKLAVGAQNIPTGVKTFTDTTQSTDKDTGSVVLQGGLGVEKNINAGGSLGALGGLNVSGGAWQGSLSNNSSATGASASVATPSTLYLSVSNGSLASIAKFSTPVNNQLFVLINKVGASIVIKNTDAAADDILTGTGADMTVAANASVWLVYDTTATRWRVVGGSGSGGGGGGSIDAGVSAMFTGSTAPTGWLFLDGSSIGSVTSGATARANSDTLNLYTLLWNDYANTELTIQDSSGANTTRGASAVADFAADKRMPLPNFQGIFPRGVGSQTISSIAYTGGVIGTKQSDMSQGHRHASANTLIDSTARYNTDTGGPYAFGRNDLQGVYDPVTDTVNGTPRTGFETRPVNMSINFIVKY